MPISYSIDAGINVIFETWVGDVSTDELRRYWDGYLADPNVLAVRRTLADLRQANPLFTGLELSEAVNSVVVPALEGRDWKTAIVVERPVQFGISRQYQVFAEQYSRDAIFYDHDAALRLADPTGMKPVSRTEIHGGIDSQ